MRNRPPEGVSDRAPVPHQRRRALRALSVLAATAACATGCSTARVQIEEAQRLHASGDVRRAYELLANDPDRLRDETREALLWRMEEGKMAQDAGEFVASQATLLEASRLADQFDLEWSKTTLGEELGSIAVNPRLRTYRGTSADRVMIEYERMVSALLAGDGYGAMIAARRTLERQRDVEVDERKRIADAEEEIAKRGGASAVQAILAGQGIGMGEGYVAYLNPAASWLVGMVQLSTGDGNDRQRGETSLRRALAMMPDSATLAAQVAENPFDRAARGTPQVIVLFGLGSAPVLEQITIPLVTPWLGLSTIPIPRLVFPPKPGEALQVRGGGAVVRTELLADIDAIWKQSYDNRLPEVILQIVLMVAAKEAATAAAMSPFWSQDTNEAYLAQFLILTAASLYKGATNQIDLRTWRSLPAQIQIAELPRPGDGLVRLSLVRGGVPVSDAEVALPEAPVVLLWARAIGPDRLFVRAVPLQATSVVPSTGSVPVEVPSESPDAATP